MKKFFYYFLALVGLVILGASYFIYFHQDNLLKSLIEKEGSKILERKLTIKKLELSFKNKNLLVSGIQVENTPPFTDHLLSIAEINIPVDPKVFLKKPLLVTLDKIELKKINFSYEVKIINNKVVDNLKLLVDDIKKKTDEKKNTNKKNEEKRKPNDNNFVIKKLIIDDSIVHAVSKDLQFDKKIQLKGMEFSNIGNVPNTTHYKDLAALIFTNVLLQINNQIIINKLNQKFGDKIDSLIDKKILNKNDQEFLKGKKEEILKNLNKIIK